VLTRSGASPGDDVFISGVPGEAAAGLALLRTGSQQEGASARLRQRFLRPKPRLDLGRALRTIASAAMDVSDGLLADLEKLCAASGCGARLELDALPPSVAMRALFNETECLQYALAGGDDYELLFTVAPANAAAVRSRSIAGTPVTRIGVMTEERSVRCFLEGSEFFPERTGYDHFAEP
jgi:thiamine-monophosphate kinase